jgi:zinc protease
VIRRDLFLLALLALPLGCQRFYTTDPSAPPSHPKGRIASVNEPTVAADPLGPPPKLAAPRAFEPAPPDVFKVGPITVWHLHRPQLPLVSATFLVPIGGAADPKDKPGAASLTADMMDEGAGARGAVELSTELQDLGAELRTSAGADASFASMTVLKKRFEPAFAILTDVVARPRFEDKEYKRVHGLWKDALKKRADDPASVAGVVAQAAMYGRDAAYGHPTMGWPSSADAVTLDEVKRFHAAAWRPEHLVLVIAGQIERAEIETALGKNLASWAPKGPAAVSGTSAPREDRPRLVIVDRPKAVQSALYVVREGVKAGAPGAAPLELVNTALGGSFTSRLNMNLREDKGWTYGARTGFTETRGVGTFVARAAVQAEFTGPALQETLKELSKMAESGPTDAEIQKSRAQDRAELVQAYETVAGASGRLAQLAALGLPPGFDAQATRERATADREALTRLARAAVDPSRATIVIVGDLATVKAQLAPLLGPLGLPEPQIWDVEARPLKGAAPTAAGR